MKKLILTLSALSVLVPSLASAMSVAEMEPKLKIVPRWDDGSIQKEIERVQTYLVGEGKQLMWKLDRMKYDANYREVGKYVTCYKQPAQCSTSWRPNK